MEAHSFRAPAGLRRLRGGPLLRLRSDDQLLAAFRAGSDEAFGVLHDRYRQRLLTYARQMLGGSPSDAEDALQDVFLRAYNALRADDRPVSVRAWLYRVAHNRCIDQLRRAKPPTVDLDDPSQPEPAATDADMERQDPARVAARREELRTLVSDVGRLPEQQRSALLLREMEGLTYAELADALECSVPAVKSLLVRARMGLVEQAEARALSCADIRADLDQAHDRGVRMSGRARRHLRDCEACRAYRHTLKGVASELHGLAPAAGLWAKLLGLGGAGSGAAAGGAAAGSAAAGGGIALLGGGAASTVSKFAAIFCCAAVVGGGAREVQQRFIPSSPPAAETRATEPPAADAPVVSRVRTQVTATAPAAAASGKEKAADDARAKREAREERAAEKEPTAAEGTVTPVPGTLPGDSDAEAAENAGSLLAPDAPAAPAHPAPSGPAATTPPPESEAPTAAPRPAPAILPLPGVTRPGAAPPSPGAGSETTGEGSVPAEGPGGIAAPGP